MKNSHLVKITLCLLIILALFSIRNTPSQHDEITQIKSTNNTKVQSEIYRNLINRVGAVEAQQELYDSGLPFTGETHLLNHTVGDYLYEKYGTKGLVQCKDYFLSSCYHGFILNAIADGGMSRLAETFKECVKQGPVVYTQCSHGIGHGFLVSGGYRNLVGALESCDLAEKNIIGFPVYNCYDGVFMENIWAVHEGEPSQDRWVKEENLFYPCNDTRIDSKYRKACWSNQPALAYQLLKGDIGKVATDVCGKLEEGENKKMCFNGLARQIHPLARGSSEKTFKLCGLILETKWSNLCLVINAGASYSVGDRVTPFEICRNIGDSGKEMCYQEIIKVIKSYKKPNEDLKNLCLPIKELVWRNKCELS